ncbi:uncharacterized protein LOC128217643 [Mya arenaria]|uniref:uncharacterized protein LOC128217643 n=1 Tax=Mya arenaria TaxID=6604 RepID=UPI0022DF9CFC|nr:uncharacterized protein LOC128217643 [Mya arenaria]
MDQIEEARKLHFSVDLVSQAHNHLEFLCAIDRATSLRNVANLRRALYRYERYWLPLAADHPGKQLSGPLDVEWMWHCHMLSPKKYIDDCKAVCGSVVDHTLKNKWQFGTDQKRATSLWSEKYPDEPFHPSYKAPFDESKLESFSSKISYDIIAAASRQGVFFYQVSLPHYQDTLYLQDSLQRYKQFLYLRTKVNGFITPCFDQDLMWHSHQVNPLAYAADTKRIVGFVFNHDDSTNDRTEGSDLVTCHKSTSEEWQSLFDEPFASYGAMYRGYPYAGYFYDLSSNDLISMSSKDFQIQFDQFKLTDVDAGISINDCVLEITTDRPETNKHVFETALPSQTKQNDFISWAPDSVILPITTEKERSLLISLKKKTKFLLFGTKYEQLTTGVIDIASLVKNGLSKEETNFDCNVDMRSAQLELQGSIRNIQPNTCKLVIQAGEFKSSVVPETVRQSWGPMPLERLPTGRPNECREAIHTLLDGDGKTLFTVRVLQSSPLTLSCVRVLYEDKPVAFASLTHLDQLPLTSQVSSSRPCLNPREGDHAMTIKSHKGDWGILVGRWIPSKTVQKQNDDGDSISYGTMQIKFFHLTKEVTESVTLQYSRSSPVKRFKLQSVDIDLETGSLSIDASTAEVGEHIALAFSVGLMHVLCTSRPKDWNEGAQFPSPFSDISLVKSCGLYNHAPTGQFVISQFGEKHAALCGGGKIDCSKRWEQLAK